MSKIGKSFLINLEKFYITFTISTKSKAEKVQSKTARQVCDRENTICIHEKGCKSFIFLNFVLNKFFG